MCRRTILVGYTGIQVIVVWCPSPPGVGGGTVVPWGGGGYNLTAAAAAAVVVVVVTMPRSRDGWPRKWPPHACHAAATGSQGACLPYTPLVDRAVHQGREGGKIRNGLTTLSLIVCLPTICMLSPRGGGNPPPPPGRPFYAQPLFP